MEKEIVVLIRHNQPDWEFEWDDEYSGLIHKTSKNIYKLFCDNIDLHCKPIWIGRLINNECWVTWEKELKADRINFIGCSIVFET